LIFKSIRNVSHESLITIQTTNYITVLVILHCFANLFYKLPVGYMNEQKTFCWKSDAERCRQWYGNDRDALC